MNALLRFRVAHNLKSQAAAAKHFKVSERSWRQWEKDGTPPRSAALRERLRQGGVVFDNESDGEAAE